MVRRWLPDTRLNGRAFDDAELLPGDRLSIGAIELEVLEPPQLPNRPPLSDEPMPASATADRPKSDTDAAELAAELDARRNTLDEQQRRWETDRAEADRQAAARTEQLDARTADMAARQEALDQQQRGWEAGRAEIDEQVASRTEQLDARTAELAALQRAIEEQQRRWETDQTEADRQAASRAEQLDDLKRQLEVERETLRQRQQQWEAEHVAIESEQIDPAAGPPTPDELAPPADSESAPAELDDALGRIRSMGLLREPDQDEQRSDEVPPADGAAIAERPPSAQPAVEEEESVDAYMSRLMDRVRTVGGQSQPSTHQPPKLSQPQLDPAATPDSTAAPADIPTPPAASEDEGSATLSPRTVARERSIDLSAMREVANVSAHTAIDKHTRHQMKLGTRSKLLITMAGLVAGVLLLWMAWMGFGRLAFYAAMASFIVALFWGFQCAAFLAHVVTGTSARVLKKINKPPPECDGSDPTKE